MSFFIASIRQKDAKNQIEAREPHKDHGLENDTYAGAWHKQLSFLPSERINNAHCCELKFLHPKMQVSPGLFRSLS